jgi:hypothetical protein
LELIRQWIKYYADKWQELDRQKRRDESNLFAFLEYILQAQNALKATVEGSSSHVSADDFAEWKQVQTEIAEEIPTLLEKLDKELRPADASIPNSSGPGSQDASDELREGIRMLQSWAGTASESMYASAKSLGLREPKNSLDQQQLAIDALEKIWDAIVPFHPLLSKELNEQTSIAKRLQPNSPAAVASDSEADPDNPFAVVPKPDNVATSPDEATSEKNKSIVKSTDEESPVPSPAEESPAQELAPDLAKNDLDYERLVKDQAKTLRRTQMLVPKAEMELKQFESQSAMAGDPNSSPSDSANPDPSTKPSEVDPAEVKAGYEKAIELAPVAVERMEAVTKHLQQKDWKLAAKDAEEARRILEEIQKAQPKKPQDQQDQDQQDQKQEPKDNQQKDSEKEKEKEQDKEPQKKEDEKKEDEKDSESKKEDEKQGQKEQQPQAKVSPDQIEEALRKVRERQEEKREKDRELKARILGRLPVDKDW